MHEEQPIKGNLRRKPRFPPTILPALPDGGRVVLSPLILTPVEIAHNKDIAAASKEPP
jgi:hypothetical protein